MQNIDADQFGRLLTETAECYSQKALTAGAQRRWFEVLRDIPFERVQSAVRVYMRTRQRMPAPADILGISESLGPRNVDIPLPTAEPERSGVTEHGRKCAAAMRQFLSQGFTRPSKRWAQDIIAAHELGEPLRYRDPMTGERLSLTEGRPDPITEVQLRLAREAIRPPVAQRERVPGEDDE